jgi:MFS superfamily sulfate permease-like transporter
MAVQATGAMALIVADSDLQTLPDPDRALFTLAIMTGIVMIIAGLLGGGRLVRFVPTAVMTGFITAVGINIVLGQLANFTGYASEGANRVTKLFDLLVHVPQWSLASVTVGLLVIALIYLFRLTPLEANHFGFSRETQRVFTEARQLRLMANDLLLVPMLLGGERCDGRSGLRDRDIQGSRCVDQLGQRRTLARHPLAEFLDFPLGRENSS